MVEAEQILNFHTANNAATHLGRKLYTTTPPALAELIANSYDAYATKVDVKLDSNNGTIIVADDGIGMDYTSLEQRYVEVGKEKTPDPTPPDKTDRLPMGKKGIGKLASFSLGGSYTVYTKTAANPLWISFTVKYEDMINPSNSTTYDVTTQSVEYLPAVMSDYNKSSSGFIVIISDLRRRITTNTINQLTVQLSRRFFLHDVDFCISVNGNEIDLSRKDVYNLVQALTYVGYSEEEIHELFGERRLYLTTDQYKNGGSNSSSNALISDEFKMNAQANIISYNNTISEDDDFTHADLEELLGHGAKGWVGVFDKPQRLKNIGLGGVVVYINGKVADEDFLKEHRDAQMGSQYIVGEIFADYLNTQEDEPITSSRQGLDEGDPSVAKLLDLALRLRTKAIQQWNTLRDTDAVDKMPAIVRNNENYQRWAANLTKDQKKLNNKLLRTITIKQEYGEDSEDSIGQEAIISLVNSFTQIVESEKTLDLSRKLSNIEDLTTDSILDIMSEYLAKVATQEKIRQADVISERLKAINKLEMLMADPTALEKTFEQQLYDNPWLINPYWNQTSKTNDEINIKRQPFMNLYDAEEDTYRRNYLDLYVEVADEEFPIVVELKKNNPTGHAGPHAVNAPSIIQQITKYRKAIVQHMTSEEKQRIGDSPKKIKAFFIYSEDSGLPGQGNKITFDRDDLETIDQLNIRLMTYRDLVSNAKKSYREFIKVLEHTESTVPYIALPSESEEVVAATINV